MSEQTHTYLAKNKIGIFCSHDSLEQFPLRNKQINKQTNKILRIYRAQQTALLIFVICSLPAPLPPHYFTESSRPTEDPRYSTSIAKKHLSKSTSELSCREFSIDTPNSSPLRTKGSINPSVVGVLQKTHGFFSTLKVSE